MKNKYKTGGIGPSVMALYLALAPQVYAPPRSWHGGESPGSAATVNMEMENVVGSRSAWERMSAADWDKVPETRRKEAFLRMIDHSVDHYDVGHDEGLPKSLIKDVARSIAVKESGLDHRAVNPQTDDYGLMQLSPYARRKIEGWSSENAVDIRIKGNEDWFNPYTSAKAGVYWFSLMLEESEGDLNRAIRAYNVGIDRAKKGSHRGFQYQRAVKSIMKNFSAGN